MKIVRDYRDKRKFGSIIKKNEKKKVFDGENCYY